MLEVRGPDLAQVLKRYRDAGLYCLELGATGDAGPHALVRERAAPRGGPRFACAGPGEGGRVGRPRSGLSP